MQEKPDAADIASGQEISLFDVLNFLTKYKKKILGVAVIAGLLAAVVAMRMPDVYTARLKIFPQALTPPQGQLIQSLLESGSFADILVRRFNLTQAYEVENINEARDQFMHVSTVKPDRDAVLTIEVDDVDPKRALALVNAYPEELDKLIVSMDLNEATRQRKKIELRLQDMQGQLDIINKNVDATGRKLPVDTINEEEMVNIASLRAQLDFISDLEAKTTNVMANLDRLREQLDRLFQPAVRTNKHIRDADRNYLEQFSQAKYLEVSIGLLKKRQAQLRLDEQMNKTRVLDLATLPEKKSKPKRLLIVVSTMLAAIFLTGLLMLLKEWFAIIRKQERRIVSTL